MDMRIDGASIRAALKEGGASVFELVREAVNQRTLEECEAAFRDAVDAGIENTVRALLLADVSADQVVSVTMTSGVSQGMRSPVWHARLGIRLPLKSWMNILSRLAKTNVM